MKKLEIEKTKPTYILSTFKTDIIKVGLVFSISNFFITKTSLANIWRRKKIPSFLNSALWQFLIYFLLSNLFTFEYSIGLIKMNCLKYWFSYSQITAAKTPPIICQRHFSNEKVGNRKN